MTVVKIVAVWFGLSIVVAYAHHRFLAYQERDDDLLDGPGFDRVVADLVADAENAANHTDLEVDELAMRYRQLAERYGKRRYRR